MSTPMTHPPPPPPSSTALMVQRHLSAARLSTYLRASRGDLNQAVELYEWNAAVSGALWVSMGHVEVVLRNAIHEPLTARHDRLRQPGQWYDDPAGELEARARRDVADARRRLRTADTPPPPGKVVAELSFGFWRYLLAQRYTAVLWPVIRPAFPSRAGRRAPR